MSDIKELKDEELDKVNGGLGDALTCVIVDYLDYEGGEPQTHNLGNVSPQEQCAKDWCTENNKIYKGYHLDDGRTNVYNASVLFDTISGH